MVSDEVLKQQIDEVKAKLDVEWKSLNEIFNKIKTKHNEVNELKSRRDEFNQLVKTLISNGKELQGERDQLQQSTKPTREVIKNLRLNIKEYAKQINELKNIRDGKHREAKGSIQGLQDNIAASLTTLLTMDLALKDEITLFNMIFSTKDRYEAKVEADDIHKQIQDVYSAIKETEAQITIAEQEINKVFEESQIKHQEAISKFREKDNMREQSNSLHQKVLDGYNNIKELKTQAEIAKKTVSKLKAELNELYKKLRSGEKKRREMARQEKLEDAKNKLKKEKKMDLNELRLLIESGELKD
jgi:chromosome segregation protein